MLEEDLLRSCTYLLLVPLHIATKTPNIVRRSNKIEYEPTIPPFSRPAAIAQSEAGRRVEEAKCGPPGPRHTFLAYPYQRYQQALSGASKTAELQKITS